MPIFTFNKLVRDKLRAEYENMNQKAIYRKLSKTEHVQELKRKIIEEATEIPAGGSVKDITSEIADVQQALDDLATINDISRDQVETVKQQKFAKKGGFANGTFVEKLELNDDDEWVDYYRKKPEVFPEVSKKSLTINKARTYLSFLKELPGSKMWQHLYAKADGEQEKDITNNGELSCAYMVSSVLRVFDLIDRAHATTASTIKAMEVAGWQKTDKPSHGAVIVWDQHIGFYITDEFVVSNSSKDGSVVRHALILGDGRQPIAFYTHTDITPLVS